MRPAVRAACASSAGRMLSVASRQRSRWMPAAVATGRQATKQTASPAALQTPLPRPTQSLTAVSPAASSAVAEAVASPRHPVPSPLCASATTRCLCTIRYIRCTSIPSAISCCKRSACAVSRTAAHAAVRGAAARCLQVLNIFLLRRHSRQRLLLSRKLDADAEAYWNRVSDCQSREAGLVVQLAVHLAVAQNALHVVARFGVRNGLHELRNVAVVVFVHPCAYRHVARVVGS